VALRCRCRAAALLLAAVSLPWLAGCGKEKAAPEAGRAAAVTAVVVTRRDAPVSYEFVAQTQSSRQVNIQARVSGFLEKRVYEEGSVVKEGQVLFLMDTRPFQAQVDGQKAALAKQLAGLEVARANLERTRPLTAENALSQKDLDDATGQFHSYEAAVEEAKARLESAQLDLSYCTIVSPVAGITGAAQQQDGAYISPQNSLLTTVAVLSPMWVNFSVSENQMQSMRDQVAKGLVRPPERGEHEVEVLLADGSLFPHRGRITFASPAYNAATGTFLLRASVDNPEGFLRPNQYVRARLNGAVRPAAIVVPKRAVQQGAQGHFVWVVSGDGTAQPRPVQVGSWKGDDWFISEGLQEGDRVIVDGVLGLRAGAAVEVSEAGSAPAAGA
jgi:membrane fusion protein (multidrug efflux system)